jgi:hypothetical protein
VRADDHERAGPCCRITDTASLGRDGDAYHFPRPDRGSGARCSYPMIASPTIGQLVQVWYRDGMRDVMPHHGRVGPVTVVGRGKPRNHGVKIDGQTVIVPCGNLRKPGRAVAPCGCSRRDECVRRVSFRVLWPTVFVSVSCAKHGRTWTERYEFDFDSGDISG